MLAQHKLDRINALANKKKEQGLSSEEQNEQHELRQEYLQNVRKSFKNHLKGMTVIDPEGQDVTPEKVKRMQQNEKKH
ncbi:MULTISPECIES: DUF896 domain-containing protein [Salimicrobium]|uniref:UPF0291 protein AAV35_006695 n=4 Tax=Salimicrobium TaxID=351195 RepID=K2FPC8_9BACI|nr:MULTISPECIES: DUF896 domain-containing protein [Salimicrobium]AKG04505.1 hypothetical protein AAV35_006695 [Salimicrobium jeotgali]EKE32716.1 hypothetical protein MJ3_02122 [Salimicrobium jeotgali]MBM7695298.1 uncharacterized protein YnzC (UPF0291/DUF896 family) [Salimicrobium jeotgali]PBB04594.1 DUF896 family protein [Salimicrobium humidisoli]SDX28949.1 Uncharacterized protein YnzC, UPF0291/DUF896 family [Salimicrobium album]